MYALSFISGYTYILPSSIRLTFDIKGIILLTCTLIPIFLLRFFIKEQFNPRAILGSKSDSDSLKNLLSNELKEPYLQDLVSGKEMLGNMSAAINGFYDQERADALKALSPKLGHAKSCAAYVYLSEVYASSFVY